MRAPLLRPQDDHREEKPALKLKSFQFAVENDELSWTNVPLMQLVERYGTPLKITYLPHISRHIQHMKALFGRSMNRHGYRGTHTYCYPTKTSHFRFILEEVLKNDTHLEISSALDVRIIRELYRARKIDDSTHIICNGHKQPAYTQGIRDLIEVGFNVIPVLDSMRELSAYEHVSVRSLNIGIRIATNSPGRTSRLGVRSTDIYNLYRTCIQHHSTFKLKMLHMHTDTGISDTPHYWTTLSRFVHTYCTLRTMCPHLDSINIGGGMPIAHSLDFAFNYEHVVDRIVETIARVCRDNDVPVPHLFTEFGSYTVGESGATIYQVVQQKQQSEKEMWYIIDGSLITQLPLTWGEKTRFICLPINNWSHPRRSVLLGGLTCDPQDSYTHVSLPEFDAFLEDLYVGFFHTGAYQEELGGYGGVSHCLVPAPRHVVVDRGEDGEWKSWVVAAEQGSEGMMRLLGYAPGDELRSSSLC
jgi:arginine decarboxylase